MRHVAAFHGWVLILAAVCQAQDLSVTSTAIAQVEKPNDLITVSHNKVESGQLFFIKIKAGVSYKLKPDPKFVTTTDDRTGDKVLIVTAGDEPITITAETSQVRIDEAKLKSAPLVSDQAGLERWLKSYSVPVSESRTVEIDRGLSELSKSVKSLARKIDNPEEVRAVARNYGVIASAIAAGEYDGMKYAGMAFAESKKQAIENLYLLNRGTTINSPQWNPFFKSLSKLEYQDSRKLETVGEIFLEIKQGLLASLE